MSFISTFSFLLLLLLFVFFIFCNLFVLFLLIFILSFISLLLWRNLIFFTSSFFCLLISKFLKIVEKNKFIWYSLNINGNKLNKSLSLYIDNSFPALSILQLLFDKSIKREIILSALELLRKISSNSCILSLIGIWEVFNASLNISSYIIEHAVIEFLELEIFSCLWFNKFFLNLGFFIFFNRLDISINFSALVIFCCTFKIFFNSSKILLLKEINLLQNNIWFIWVSWLSNNLFSLLITSNISFSFKDNVILLFW